MIEIGDWIRSKDGFIGKVRKISYDNMEKSNYYICEKDNVMASNYLENIAKHSKNIIDLIEVGDYVNGYKVIKLKDGFANGTMEIVLSNNTIIYRHHSEDIKTILTKEQFETNCYKVGGEDEQI